MTLVEVVLALAILAMGLTALIAAAARGLSIARKARNIDDAHQLFGVLEIEEPLYLEEDIRDAAGSGMFDAPYSQYRWSREIEAVGEEKDGLWMVTTTIGWQENDHARDETIVTYVYKPQEEDREKP